MDCIQVLMSDVRAHFVALRPAEQSKLAALRDQHGVNSVEGKRCVEALVNSVLPWALKSATKLCQLHSEHRLNMCEATCLALEATYVACKAFDPLRGTLTTIVGRTIRSKTWRYVLEDSTVLHMSSSAGAAALDRPSKDRALLPETVSKARVALGEIRHFDQYNEPKVPCEQILVDIRLDDEYATRMIDTTLSLLTPRQRFVIVAVRQGAALRLIGDVLGVSFQGVQQIRRSAITRIRKLLNLKETCDEQQTSNSNSRQRRSANRRAASAKPAGHLQ